MRKILAWTSLTVLSLCSVAPLASASEPIYGRGGYESTGAGVNRIDYGSADGRAGDDYDRIKRLLQSRGYTNVTVIGPKAPIYAASACRNGTVYAIEAAVDGRVHERERLGSCAGGSSHSLGRHLSGSKYDTRTLQEYDEEAIYSGDVSDCRPHRGYGGSRKEAECSDTHSLRAGGGGDYGRRPTSCGRQLESASRNISITFGRNSSRLSADARSSLLEFARAVRSCSGVHIEVAGFSDASGDPEWNLELSKLRAEAVAEFLADTGVDPRRLSPVGYGATAHVEQIEHEAHRQRRVAFYINRRKS